MKKKRYNTPESTLLTLQLFNLMLRTSPGVEGHYDPNKPIESKSYNFTEGDESDVQQAWTSLSHWDDLSSQWNN